MTVLWQADPTAKGFGWPDGVQAIDPSRYASVPDPLGVYPAVWHVQVRPGDNNVAGSGTGERCEGLYTDHSAGGDKVRGSEGVEHFFAWDVVYGTGYVPSPSDWNITGQWHNSGTSGGTCHVSTPGKLALRTFGGDPATPDQHGWDLAPLQTMRRYELVVYFKWSAQHDVGRCKAWLDGVEVVPMTSCATLYTGQTTYPKLGYYRAAQAIVVDIFYHGYRVTSTLADAVAAFPKSANLAKWQALLGGPNLAKVKAEVSAARTALSAADASLLAALKDLGA